MYNWAEKGFKDISNEEIKQDVLDIKKNGIVTLIALKHRATSPDTKSKIVDKTTNELSDIKKDLANTKRPEAKPAGEFAPKSAGMSAYERLKAQRG